MATKKQEAIEQVEAGPAPISKISQSVSMKNMYDSVSFWVITLAVLLLPVFVIPYTNIGFFFAKFGLVTVSVLISVITFILQVLNERKVERYSLANYGFFFGLPVVYVIASLFMTHSSLGLMGNGAETDTAFFFLLGSLLMYLIAKFYRSKNSVFMMILGMASISTLISLFHVLRFIFGKEFLSLGLFASITSNTIGSFSELGVYAGLIVLISILALELTAIRSGVRIIFYISIVLSLCIMTVANFNFVGSIFGLQVPVSLSALIAFFALILFIHKKVAVPKDKLPAVSLIVLLVSLILTIGITPISNFILPKVGVTDGEILNARVSPDGTYSVALSTYSSGIREALVGVGPNSFYQAWGKFKPTSVSDSVNSTVFWNVDFNMASGFIPTTFVTVGILGTLVWIFFLGLVLLYIVKLLKRVAKPEKDSTSVFVAWVVSVGTLYLWFVSFAYTAGPTVVFTAFAFTGLLIATLVREDIIKTKNITWDISTYWRGFLVTFGMTVLIVLCMYAGYVWQQRVYASMQVQKATSILQVDPSKVTEAETTMLGSINTYFNTADLRLASEIALIRPSELVNKTQGVVSPEKVTQVIASDITFAINTARRAAIDRGLSEDYRDWLQLGKAYETATFLGATSTATLAVESYAQAERLNPTSPIAPYLMGRLYAFARSFDIAETKLKRAVELKSDYAEAVTLLQAVQSMTKSGQKNLVTPSEEKSTSTKATVVPTKK